MVVTYYEHKRLIDKIWGGKGEVLDADAKNLGVKQKNGVVSVSFFKVY